MEFYHWCVYVGKLERNPATKCVATYTEETSPYIINPRCMHSEGHGTWFVCLSVCCDLFVWNYSTAQKKVKVSHRRFGTGMLEVRLRYTCSSLEVHPRSVESSLEVRSRYAGGVV